MTTKPYTVVINRPSMRPASNAYLSSLSLGDVRFNPDFAKDTMNYGAGVDSSVDSVTVTAMPRGPRGHGMRLPMHDSLELGRNAVTVTVTAEDGTTTMVYTVCGDQGQHQRLPERPEPQRRDARRRRSTATPWLTSHRWATPSSR